MFFDDILDRLVQFGVGILRSVGCDGFDALRCFFIFGNQNHNVKLAVPFLYLLEIHHSILSLDAL